MELAKILIYLGPGGLGLAVLLFGVAMVAAWWTRPDR